MKKSSGSIVGGLLGLASMVATVHWLAPSFVWWQVGVSTIGLLNVVTYGIRGADLLRGSK